MEKRQPEAVIRELRSECQVYVEGSYRTTTNSEHEAREWCRRHGYTVAEIRRD